MVAKCFTWLGVFAVCIISVDYLFGWRIRVLYTVYNLIHLVEKITHTLNISAWQLTNLGDLYNKR